MRIMCAKSIFFLHFIIFSYLNIREIFKMKEDFAMVNTEFIHPLYILNNSISYYGSIISKFKGVHLFI